MKKLSLLLLVTILMSFVLHKYYVSVSEIVYNSRSNQLEISLKVFNDDWQNALDFKLGSPVYLGSKNEFVAIDSLVNVYINDNFKVRINDVDMEITILGREIEGEYTWLYMYVNDVPNIISIEIINTVLTEVFEEQRNVVQLKIGDKSKSALLTRSRSSKKFIIN